LQKSIAIKFAQDKSQHTIPTLKALFVNDLGVKAVCSMAVFSPLLFILKSSWSFMNILLFDSKAEYFNSLWELL